MSKSLTRIASQPVRFVQAPGRVARGEPISTTILLFAALVGLNIWKGQGIPDTTTTIHYLLLGGGFVLVAGFAPDVVNYILLVALLIWVLRNEPAVAAAIAHATGWASGMTKGAPQP